MKPKTRSLISDQAVKFEVLDQPGDRTVSNPWPGSRTIRSFYSLNRIKLAPEIPNPSS